MKKLIIIFIISMIFGCNNANQNKEGISNAIVELIKTPKLDISEANRLAQMPLHCLDVEYPNKLNQTLGDKTDLLSPTTLHPAFYGCFDWHSAVHGHWSLVSLLKQFPNLDKAEDIKKRLLNNMSKENIEAEVAYFLGKHNKSFERTYGWTWLLKLAEEL